MIVNKRRYSTQALAFSQRNANRVFVATHATHIASIVGRLRAHARRCRVEKGYATPNGDNRKCCLDAIVGIAKKLEHRAELRLSIRWWLERATSMLAVLDKENPS